MAIANLDESYKFLPLRRYLHRADKEGWKVEKSSNNILLAKIKNLDREMVQRLEMAGIYDTDEFFSVQDEMSDYLGIEGNGISNVIQIMNNEIQRSTLHPRIDLEMRNNFAFVAVATDDEYNALSMIKDDVMFTWLNPIEEGWSLIKYAFDKTFELQDRPELLSSLMDMQGIPSWLMLEDLTIYISGLNPISDIYSQTHQIGFPINPHLDNIKELSQEKVLKLKYLYEYANNQLQ